MRWNARALWIPMLAGTLLLAVFGCHGSSSGPDPITNPTVEAPKITVQPQPQTVWSPAQATFSVVATGGGTLEYQWRRDGVDMVGVTSPSYTTGLTSVSDHGVAFSVVVSNAAGRVTSASALLSVNEKPTIQQHPGDLSVLVGQPANFTVRGHGTPVLRYQWKRNGVVIPGATDVSYGLPTTVIGDNGAVFTVEVSNSLDTALSQPAHLTVTSPFTPPTIVQQPGNVTVNAGQPATLLVRATGTEPLTYQWRRNNVNLPGATSSSLNFASAQDTDAGTYDVVVKNEAGTATSSLGSLTVVVTAPTITTQPSDAVVGTGQTASFTVVASGSQPLRYQWRRNGADITTNANAATYTTPPTVLADNNTQYTVRVSNSAGFADSQFGTLRVFFARTLSGRVGTLYQTTAGEVYAGRDLRTGVMDISQPDGHGAFTHYVTQGLQDGTFTVPGVPPGPFLGLVKGTSPEPTLGLWTSLEDLDLRLPKVGRTGGTVATSEQASLAINVQGALAGQFTRLQVLVPNFDLIQELPGGGPLYIFPWKGLRLLEASKDAAWAVGLKTQTTGPATLTTVLGALALPAITMPPANEARVNANIPAAGAAQTFTVLADTNAYAALLSGVHPLLAAGAGRGAFRADLLAQPFGLATGPLPTWATLLEYGTTFAGALDSGTLAYGDPYPASWGRLVRIRQEFSFDLPLPGTSQLAHVKDAIQEFYTAEGWSGAALAPQIGPVLVPKINGVSFFTPPASVGLTPTLTWSARPQDQPSYYVVTVFAVDPTDGTLQTTAQISTEVPNLALADGLLTAGSTYLVRIVAFQSQSYDPNLPWHQTWPVVSAPVYSGLIRP